MNSMTATYLPSGISVIINFPFLSVRPPVISSLCSSSTRDIEAYSIGLEVLESLITPSRIPIGGIAAFFE